VLIAAVLVFLVVAAANWWSRWSDDDRLELWTKPLATVLVISVAVLAGAEGDESTTVVALTVVALVFCLVGDIALMPQVDRFIVGLGAFLVGHLVFVVALAATGLDQPLLAIAAAVLIGPCIAVISRQIVSGAKAKEPALSGPVVAYLTVISAMALVAWATGNTAAIIGATLFMISDSILGWRTFVGQARWMAVWIMVTYHGAVLGLALALS
jgi:alkenylglycerophosphocholine/alkenylglycerophosphoethanolamine hydrolase